MDYFMQRCFRGTKSIIGFAGAGACGAIVIMGFMGVQSIAIPICGIVALLPVGFIFFENTKVIRDMEKYVTKFKSENKELKQTNSDLKQTRVELSIEKDRLMDENNRYEELLDDAETNLNKMRELANQYQNTSKELGQNLKNAETNRSELKSQAEELMRIKIRYESENQNLHDNVEKIKDQLDLVTQAKKDYELQLSELENNNQELEETTILLKEELEKAESSYEKSQAALKVLLQSTGVLEDLGEKMVQTEEQTSENVTMTTKLLNMLGMSRSKELFEKLDEDNDSLLSMDEFVNILLDEAPISEPTQDE